MLTQFLYAYGCRGIREDFFLIERALPFGSTCRQECLQHLIGHSFFSWRIWIISRIAGVTARARRRTIPRGRQMNFPSIGI